MNIKVINVMKVQTWCVIQDPYMPIHVKEPPRPSSFA